MLSRLGDQIRGKERDNGAVEGNTKHKRQASNGYLVFLDAEIGVLIGT